CLFGLFDGFFFRRVLPKRKTDREHNSYDAQKSNGDSPIHALSPKNIFYTLIRRADPRNVTIQNAYLLERF
ncbi:MAG: hypothetical protein VXW49_10190, partial [Pseudomonadota bacterium]|nr:hypothetical protein [Pseudomonadota bacterium]